MNGVRISDTREVFVKVSGQEPLLTPKGNRPIDPINIRVRYAIDPNTGSVFHIQVTVSGSALFPKKDTAVVTRRVDLEHAPTWAKELIEWYRPD